MKTDTPWRKFARRTAVIVSGLCCLAILTGCPWDEKNAEDLLNLYTWGIVWIDNVDPNDSGDVTIVTDFGDLTAITSYSNTYGDYKVDITVTGGNITIVIEDITADPFIITLTGTINSANDANGTYQGTSSSNNPISGTWTIAKQ